MFSLDLDGIGELFKAWPLSSQNKPALGWFKRDDFIGPATSHLKQFVLDQVEQQLGFRPDGKVTLLTHIRLWGILMNPIAVYSCYDQDGSLRAVCLQVTNTPWGEQCLYVLQADVNSCKQYFVFNKVMHVSPYHPMAMQYKCRYHFTEKQLVLHLENYEQNNRITDATLVMQGQTLTQQKLLQSVMLHPYMTAKVYFGIYWQALRLFMKKNPIFNHPDTIVKQEKYSRGNL